MNNLRSVSRMSSQRPVEGCRPEESLKPSFFGNVSPEARRVSKYALLRLLKTKLASKFTKCLVTLILASLCFGSNEGDPSRGPATTPQRDRLDADARRLAFGSVEGNFISSLEMQEAADFLLTPALLEQEAISDSVVITYPKE